MKQLLILLCQSIHAFQKERGSLCLYLSTKDEYSLNQLNQCFQKSDNLVKEILNYCSVEKVQCKTLNSEQIKSYKKLENIFNGFSNKASFRKKPFEINNDDIDIYDVTPLYTHTIIIHLTYVLTELALFGNKINPSEISALSNFINWKERIGRERALGIVGFAMNKFNSEQFTKDFNILLSEQKLNQRSFLALAGARQKKLFDDKFMNYADIDSVHKKMEADEVPIVNATNWYKLVTNKMDMMHSIEMELIKQLENNNSTKSTAFRSLLEDKKRSLVLDFPFFRNLSEETIHELFKLSNIKTYKKGSLLFLEGEPASRIYVILSGWVKIFKSTPNGDETVEQMLSTGNLVIETSIFTNDKYFRYSWSFE